MEKEFSNTEGSFSWKKKWEAEEMGGHASYFFSIFVNAICPFIFQG